MFRNQLWFRNTCMMTVEIVFHFIRQHVPHLLWIIRSYLYVKFDSDHKNFLTTKEKLRWERGAYLCRPTCSCFYGDFVSRFDTQHSTSTNNFNTCTVNIASVKTCFSKRRPIENELSLLNATVVANKNKPIHNYYTLAINI